MSLLAQSILLTPKSLGFVLQSFFSRGKVAIGVALFVSAMMLFIVIISRQFAKKRLGWRANGILLLTQVLTVIGIYLLLDGFPPRDREAGFLLSSLVTILTTYGIFTQTIHLGAPPPQLVEGEKNLSADFRFDPDTSVNALREQIESLTRQLNAERHRNTQLMLLNELSQQLEAELDPPVAAQLAVNTLGHAMDCSFVALMTPEDRGEEYVVLAAAGRAAGIIPPGHRQNVSSGLAGRTNRLKKTQLVNDTEMDADFISLDHEKTLAIISVPILQHGHAKGILEICSDKKYAFSSLDVAIAEGIASELMRAWERSSYRQRLTELIQAGISLTTLLDPQAAVQEVAVIAQDP